MAAVPSIERARPVRGSAPEVEATRDLYERYGDKILGYCLHQLGSREEAEDAAQSTFLNAFRGLRRGIEPELEAAWLFKIAHNVCLSRRRSSWRRRRVESPADLQLVEDVVPAPLRAADDLIGLGDALARLPETQRRAILLREWQGLSYREIAEELGISQSAVETLLFRARRSLAAGLEERPRRAAAARRSSSFGSLFATLKGFLVGGTTAKVATVVAVVAASSVATSVPLRHHLRPATRPVPARPVVSHARLLAPVSVVVDRPALTRPARHVVAAPARVGHGRSHPRFAVQHVRHRPHAATARRHARPVEAPPPASVAAPTHEPPSHTVPPGQAKQADGGSPATSRGQARKAEAAAVAAPIPPGQAKKTDAAKPAPPGQAKKADTGKPTPPGQAKKAEPPAAPPPNAPQSQGQGQANGADGAVPPGQAKQTTAADPAPQAATPAVDSVPPGEAKKEDVAAAAPAAPAPEPVPPVVAADPEPGAQSNGNANGHGQKDH